MKMSAQCGKLEYPESLVLAVDKEVAPSIKVLDPRSIPIVELLAHCNPDESGLNNFKVEGIDCIYVSLRKRTQRRCPTTFSKSKILFSKNMSVTFWPWYNTDVHIWKSTD